MVQTLITYEEALTIIGTLPSMEPRPNATIIRVVDRHLDERLSTIPSFQSATLGYAGIAKKAELYALNSTVPWVDFDNPGPVRQVTDGSLEAGGQRDQQAIYDGHVTIFTSQANVKQAIIAALNLCVPKNTGVWTAVLERKIIRSTSAHEQYLAISKICMAGPRLWKRR